MAASLVFSVVHDARLLGEADPTEVLDCYVHVATSREELMRYISRMERQLGVQQDTIVRF